MAPDVRRRTDAEDVVQSVYRSFFDRQKRGEFEIRDRDDLRALLARITLNKVRNAAIRERRQVRDARRERHDAGAGAEDSFGSPLAALEGREPTPEEAAMLEEDGARLVAAVAELIDALDERLQRVARWKLEGLTNREIAGADRLDCSERNVERMVAAIRRKWGAVSSLEI
jgi:RNA polymerase sigma-70 factor (ECF subfamily)